MTPKRLSRSTPLRVLAVWMTLISLRTPLAQAADAKSPRRPNVIVILVDDMGWRDCGACGSQDYEPPHIDALAANPLRSNSSPVMLVVAEILGSTPIDIPRARSMRRTVRQEPDVPG